MVIATRASNLSCSVFFAGRLPVSNFCRQLQKKNNYRLYTIWTEIDKSLKKTAPVVFRFSQYRLESLIAHQTLLSHDVYNVHQERVCSDLRLLSKSIKKKLLKKHWQYFSREWKVLSEHLGLLKYKNRRTNKL